MSAPSDNRSWSTLVWRGVLLCVAIKLVTWCLGYALACTVTFDRREYFGNYGHYLLDTRAVGPRKPSFFEVWNYSDGEWYLTLAANGYPDLVANPQCGLETPPRPDWSTEKHCKHKYAFFPLYPLAIAALASFLPLTAAAFVVTAMIGVAASACLVVLFARCFPGRDRDALTAAALFFLYPFAIFYQLYFSESLFLLLSVLAFVCAWRRNWIAMLAAGALLASARPLGILIVPPLLLVVLEVTRGRAQRERWLGVACALLVPLGLVPFALLNHVRTGDWHFFSTAQELWGYENAALGANLWKNVVGAALAFPSLPWHRFHKSRLDYLIMLAFGAVLVAMWRDRRFPRALTLWSTLLWVAPLASKDLMSFGRYMSVSFPVFMFAAFRLHGAPRTAVLVACAAGYVVALYGIMTYAWVG
jgi:hypothetical protein